MQKKELIKSIKRFIQENYGLNEAKTPCYNVDKLAEYILKDIPLENKTIK